MPSILSETLTELQIRWGIEDDSDCVTDTLPSILSETLTEIQIRWGIEDDSDCVKETLPSILRDFNRAPDKVGY